MAWRLNCILAKLHPLAIPSSFRERPKKKIKDFVMVSRPLPFAVLNRLAKLAAARDRSASQGWRDDVWVKVPGCYDLLTAESSTVAGEVDRILESLGGTPVAGKAFRWAFDYNPLDVVQEIIASGCLPDQKTHQFYPTPERLARIAVGFAMEGATGAMQWLEPEAGMGGIADYLPKERTTCIEISALHCKVLESKSHHVFNQDFLEWDDGGALFDRIVMNPPFSSGRWQAHLARAAECLAEGGRLVAILPASANGKDLPGLDCAWHGPYDNEFAGTSVSVCILVADR